MKRISMRIFFSITLLLVCFIVNAQKPVKQEPSKEDYERRAKQQKPKASKIQKDSVIKLSPKEKQKPSKELLGERSKWEKPKAIRMPGAEQQQKSGQNNHSEKQPSKGVKKENPKANQQRSVENKKAIGQQQESAGVKSMTQKYRDAKKIETEQQEKVTNQQEKPKSQQSIEAIGVSKNTPNEATKTIGESQAPGGKLKEMSSQEKNLAHQKLQAAKARKDHSRQGVNTVTFGHPDEKPVEKISEEGRELLGFIGEEEGVASAIAAGKGFKLNAKTGIIEKETKPNDKQLDNILEEKKRENDIKQKYKQKFNNPNFRVNNKKVMDAHAKWRTASDNAKKLSIINEHLSQIRQNVGNNESEIRRVAKQKPELRDYVTNHEKIEGEKGKRIPISATASNQASKAKNEEEEKLSKLIEQFQNCKECNE